MKKWIALLLLLVSAEGHAAVSRYAMHQAVSEIMQRSEIARIERVTRSSITLFFDSGDYSNARYREVLAYVCDTAHSLNWRLREVYLLDNQVGSCADNEIRYR